MNAMSVAVRVSELCEITALRMKYREEMNCQIVHDSIHVRPGWTREYILELGGSPVGYGSLAVSGPWRDTTALYEFYIENEQRTRAFDLFAALLAVSEAQVIETQTNDRLLTVMLHTLSRRVRTESILFEDSFQTSFAPEGACVRAAATEDTEMLRYLELDDQAQWVVTLNGEIAGAGGVLYHYNRPYGDIYMKIAEPLRRRGLGAYLVQELKAACRASDSVPAARCNVENLASRRALQKSGFIPCGNIVIGELSK